MEPYHTHHRDGHNGNKRYDDGDEENEASDVIRF